MSNEQLEKLKHEKYVAEKKSDRSQAQRKTTAK